jgi:hypothetical protein
VKKFTCGGITAQLGAITDSRYIIHPSRTRRIIATPTTALVKSGGGIERHYLRIDVRQPNCNCDKKAAVHQLLNENARVVIFGSCEHTPGRTVFHKRTNRHLRNNKTALVPSKDRYLSGFTRDHSWD